MTYTTTGTIGVNTAEVYATTSTWPHKLGTPTECDLGQNYIFVLATSAITAGDTVLVNNSFGAQPITGALVSGTTAGRIGFATRGAIASGSAGWVALGGNSLSIRVTAGTQINPNTPLYTTDTAGVLSGVTASASHFQLFGVVLTATASGSTATSVTAVAPATVIARRPIN